MPPKSLKDAQAPWTVRGVSHEARSAALKAAEISGQKVGEWLSRVIQEAASGDIKESRAVGKTVEQMAADMMEQMRAFTEAQAKQAETQADVLQRMTERLEVVEQGRQRGFFDRLFSVGRGKAKELADVNPPAPHS